jgi:NitT/TauT family transport system ATP-binding protein
MKQSGPGQAAVAGEELVTLTGVAKRFANGTLALESFDLVIRRGEFVALLGPSGCGKSTALRLIAGLAKPSAGIIAREDDRGAKSASGRRKPREAEALGFVFQEPTLMPWASVFQNVMLPLKLAAWPREAAAKQVTQVLQRVGLAGFSAAYPRELSGGMKMRASIARALVTEPALLLMDEPFAALDEITRFKLNDDLLELWRSARHTVVFVTHSVFESVYLASRIVVMSPRPGRVVAEVPIEATGKRDETFRTSAKYAGYCRLLSQALARAMAPEENREQR